MVGLLALAVILPWIAWTLQRGLRTGRLPIGRAHVARDERPGAYRALIGFWGLLALAALFIGLDLLFGPQLRSWL